MAQARVVLRCGACSSKPALCFIVQGEKIVRVGDEQLSYDENQFLYSSVELPIHLPAARALWRCAA